ncbi:hypothetical protein BJP41_10420 (plasmid) [Candidatus Williamhamiltonella defendens]|uniref:Uncharacterized protein n=1 Tax=Candidatus Williamhamiltonella defendens TaxID=138072 RepID=A0A2D3T505_9ENTR|nr:hypothetical protein BJP41_10420 [Candidatus Hamiltonella defensa]ATW32887.1 hypothetical protein BJP42_10890 [Candidatus Hamiltonella defensa]ATW34798.1 hypothetical protein BJP43_10410 [Candidatus Hamiltonella defensa]ATW34822.1 hypothetical protein BJP43_10545 [Candidatus Hamiltonella defensa]AYB49929.1 hypothetical protein CJJ19_10900 [Candidatus Hamiltonella defensa]
MDKCQVIDVPIELEKKREWIKYKLKIHGLSLAPLGRKHKTSRQVVSTTLYKPSPRWEHEIPRKHKEAS